MSDPETLPLFPLPLTVLPTEFQVLHIFEERYKKMIRDCLAARAAGGPGLFGIVTTADEGMSREGTAVEISHLLQEYDDGRKEIVVRGLRRFQVRSIRRDHLYDSAEVAWYDDEPGDDWDESLATRAYGLHRRVFELLGGQPIPDHAYCGTGGPSMRIAQLSGLDAAQKLELLRMRRENDRLRSLVSHLEGLLPAAELTAPSRTRMQDAWTVIQFLACKCREK